MEVQKQIEIYKLDNDIKVFFVTASAFPEGITDAFDRLHSLLPSIDGREFFGISCPNKEGVIVYKAAVAELATGEAEKCGCETFIISKGEYFGTLISHFRKDMSVISKTFKTLLSNPEIDTNGFCLEVYLSEEDVMCMVKKDSSTINSEIRKNKEPNHK